METGEKWEGHEIKIIKKGKSVKEVLVDGISIKGAKSCVINSHFESNSSREEVIITISLIKSLEIIKE